MIPQALVAKYTAKILEVAANSVNEEQFKINAEAILASICKGQGIFWNPYTYEHTFNSAKGSRRADAIHGSTIVEYEPPRSFKRGENAQLRHAREQAEEYTNFLSNEEGRALGAYSMVVWDGETISFGHFVGTHFEWEPPRRFDDFCLIRLITLIADGGRPLVSPLLLRHFIGPQTEIGQQLLPTLFSAICHAQQSRHTTRTKLIFTEWNRLFGQISGNATDRLVRYMEDISQHHKTEYSKNPQAYVFALNTYIAIISKICAVFALTSQSDSVFFDSDPKQALIKIENGEYFKMFGIENMLNSDFFSWYLGDDIEIDLNTPLGLLLERLRAIDFNVSLKTPQSIRDLFKGLYMGFTPPAMRHALGEYYTPDWLAAHVIDMAKWRPNQTLLDPTCGSGTFILEGLKRRICHTSNERADGLLNGLYGFDLNPLAVLTAKASIVVFLSGKFNQAHPVLLPIFLADAINTAEPKDNIFTHTILTEKGPQTFSIPAALAASPQFFSIMNHLKSCIDANLSEGEVVASLQSFSSIVELLDNFNLDILHKTVRDLISLHNNHWNGIWCLILFDRIRAGCIKEIDLVVGNPPWVKWSNLPSQYADFIKPICDRMDIFSEDNWVGGIQSDVSTVVAYHALERFVRPGGTLAFLITATVFKNESSQGFRRWMLHTAHGEEPVSVEVVEDYGLIRPFEGVSNLPALLVVSRNGRETSYPIRYRRYSSIAEYEDLFAIPIPKSVDGPWLIGSEAEILFWPKIFNADTNPAYRARKGVTTDLNGLFFVKVSPTSNPDYIRIENDPRNGRQNLPAKSAYVERDNIFPLLRGRDIKRFSAIPQHAQCVIIPQRGMFGDANLPVTNPRLFQFLSAFKTQLEARSSYRRFQRGKPFWSTWSTGDYTFAPFKVVWRELSGSSFAAAYIGTADFCGEEKVIVPDHKVYFVPLDTENEAAYLTSLLNSHIISSAINAYAAALSLGTSVVEYLNIPKFVPQNSTMQEMAEMAKNFKNGKTPTVNEETRLEDLVLSLLLTAGR